MIQSRHTDRNFSFCQSYLKCEYRASRDVIEGGGGWITPNLIIVHGIISCVIANKHVTLCWQNCTLKEKVFLANGEFLYLEMCHNNFFRGLLILAS